MTNFLVLYYSLLSVDEISMLRLLTIKITEDDYFLSAFVAICLYLIGNNKKMLEHRNFQQMEIELTKKYS